MSRNKGKCGERELAKLLREYGYETRRGQQYNGADGSADVVGLPRIHIECKRVERLNIWGAMCQAVSDCAKGRLPAVFHRRNGERWLVTMRLADWMELYQEFNAGKWMEERG